MTLSLWEQVAEQIDPSDGSLWKPHPKQAIAERFAHQADELLFGGAAGPGKTEWGIEHVIGEMERHPKNRGVVVRRVFPSLTRTIIPRMRAKLWGRARWNGTEHTFTFPNQSILEVASLQYKDDVLAFQGAELGVVFFEELTEFLQSQWEFMIARLRAPAEGIRAHAIATTNPGGIGHTWVKRRFIRPKAEDLEHDSETPMPMEIWRPRFDPQIHTPEAPPNTRVFVPATMQDNPTLLARDPGYLARVRAISNRGLRMAMEYGDWDAIDAIEGALWTRTDLDEGRISPQRYHLKVPISRRVVAVDPSDGLDEATGKMGDEFGVCVAARGMDGRGYVEQSYAWNESPRLMARKAVQLYHDTGADALVVERNHGGRWLMEVFRGVDRYVNLIDVWASEGKRTRAEPVAALFTFEEDRQPPQPQQWASLVGQHEDLEEELTTYTGEPGSVSPNRLDALVWAMTELMIKPATGVGMARDERHEGRR